MSGSPSILYFNVILLTCVFAFAINNYRQKSKTTRFLPFILAFLVPTLFISFTDTGADYYSYYGIIEERHTFKDIVDDINTEPLFTTWSTLGWLLFGNAHLVIWSMKIGSLIALYYSFYLLKDKIDVSVAIMAYMSIAYIMSFYLISINLAACFLCLSLALTIEKGFTRGIITALCACGFHYSAALAVLPLVAYKFVFLKNDKNSISGWRFFIVLVVFSLLFYGFANILISIVKSYEQFEHYNKYIESIGGRNSSGSGLLQIVYYIPIMYALYNMYVNRYYSRQLFVLFLFFSLFGLASAELGYVIPILKRSYFIFIAVFSIILPYFIRSQRLPSKTTPKPLLSWKQLRILAVLYFVFRLYITFKEHVRPDDTSELFFYNFFNPFTF